MQTSVEVGGGLILHAAISILSVYCTVHISVISGHVRRKLSSVQRGPSLLLTEVVLKSPLDGPLDSLSRGKQ